MDAIVYELSSMSESDPNIFIKKDWVSILDNQNANYAGNQAVIDTSQLSNSNKWINYREGYLTIPLQLCMSTVTASNTFAPQTTTTAADYAVGLKNWYGSVIHSISVDLAGSTIIQQTPFQSLWNNFKLLTTLSYQDLLTIGPSIGFYPDNSSSWSYNTAASVYGSVGVSNNVNNYLAPVVSGPLNSLEQSNTGMYQRQKLWNFNILGLTGVAQSAFSVLISQTALNQVFKSQVIKCSAGVWQANIIATVFFDLLLQMCSVWISIQS